MSNDALERLRRENPVPEMMPALPIDPVRARLSERPTSAPRTRISRRRARGVISVLPAIASVAVVVAVIAVVLTAGGHGRPSTTPTGHAAGLAPAPAPETSLPESIGSGAASSTPASSAAQPPNPFQVARANVHDAPIQLFESPALARMGPGTSSGSGVPITPDVETVIPSSVRRIDTFTLAGVGPIQYWVADTKQHGICTALRLPDGDWAGLQNGGRVAGSMPGCRPTRGGGGVTVDGFDYEQTGVTGTNGKSWAIQYGAVTVSGAAQVRETVNGVTAPIIDGRYFAIALQPASRDWGDTGRLEALNASGQQVAEEGHPLRGTSTSN